MKKIINRNKALKSAVCLLIAVMTVLTSVVFMPSSVQALDDPQISDCASALVYCVESGTVLWSRDPDKKVYPARLVKLMTALIAVEKFQGDLDRECTASVDAITNLTGLAVGFKVGERIPLRHLIAVMIHTGANDAAHIIAEEVSGSLDAFVEEMNKKAKELGMDSTVFTNVTGMHEAENVTTARDMLRLAVYCTGSRTLLDICSMIRVVIPKTNKCKEERAYGTTNYLISPRVNPDYYTEMANGMICGSTDEAGYCMIASAENDGKNYISVVMGAGEERVMVTPPTESVDENGLPIIVPAKYKTNIFGLMDSAELLQWADKNFVFHTAISPTMPICQVDVRLGKSVDKVVLVPSKSVELFLPSDIVTENDIAYSYELVSETVTAPVKAGQVLGTLKVSYKGDILGEAPLVVSNNIEQSVWLTMLDGVKQLSETAFFKIIFFTFVFGAVIYVIMTAAKIAKQKKQKQKRRN